MAGGDTGRSVFQDESILITNSDTKKVLFINSKGEKQISSIETASASENKDLAKRLKYTEEVLNHIWTAQTEATPGKTPRKDLEAQNDNADFKNNLMEKPLGMAGTAR